MREAARTCGAGTKPNMVSFSLSTLPELKPWCQKKGKKKEKGEQAQFRPSLLVLAAEVSDY